MVLLLGLARLMEATDLKPEQESVEANALLPLKACIFGLDSEPCVHTPQWNEWKFHCVAELVYTCPASTEGGEIEATVTWSRKFYGESNFVYMQTTMTGQIVGTDGTRCLNGDPVHDGTWQITLRASISYGGSEYVAYRTVGGPEAEYYYCCPGQNCNQWFECP
jgi:hypothetical protein